MTERRRPNPNMRRDGRVSFGFQNAEFFASRKTGPYLVVKDLEEVAGNKSLSYRLRSYAEIAIREIDAWGDNSVVHLCLPTYSFRALSWRKIHTISELRAILNSSEAIDRRGFGGKTLDVTRTSLEVFDKQLAQVG